MFISVCPSFSLCIKLIKWLSLTSSKTREEITDRNVFTFFDSESGLGVTVADLARVDTGVFHRQIPYHQRMNLPIFAAHFISTTISSSSSQTKIITFTSYTYFRQRFFPLSPKALYGKCLPIILLENLRVFQPRNCVVLWVLHFTL